MLVAFLGETNVKQIESGVNPDIDCYVDSEPLSIKTVSLSGGIRLKWTSNAVKSKEFISSFEPNSNLLVIRVSWGYTGTISFIPLEAQQHFFKRYGVNQYLDYRGSTNTRGVNLSSTAEYELLKNPSTVILNILWGKSGSTVNPVKQWTDYWLGKSSL